MRARQLDIRERGVKLMDDEVSPLLPEMKEFMQLPPPYEGADNTGQQGASDPVPPALPPQAQMLESTHDGAL
jgi:hypothetical protein